MDKRDHRLAFCWAGLVALTLASFESAWGGGWLGNPGAAIALVIGIALLKVRIVVLEFMEVRHAPMALRLPLETWIIAIAGGILALWYAAGA